MLNKLLKYDLKYMIKNMLIFYILAIFFAITTRILFSMNQTVMIKILSQISVGCMFSMVASIIINVMMRCWVRFRDCFYKDESYLTHTLPVSKTDLYESKFIQTMIFSIISFIVSFLSIFITYYTEERWQMLTDAINGLSKNLNVNTTLFIIGIILLFFIEIINMIQSGYLGMIIANRKENQKLAFTFIYGFISYMISQVFVVLSLLVIGLFNNDIMDAFKSEVLLNNNTLKLLMIFSIVIYLIIIFIMNIICTKELEKGVNVE